MRGLHAIVTGATLLLGLPAAAQAQETPPYVGLWGFGGCDSFRDIEYQGHFLVAFTRDGPWTIVPQHITKADHGNWYFQRTGPEDPEPGLMRLEEGVLVSALPMMSPTDKTEVDLIHRFMFSGAVSPDKRPDFFDLFAGVPCAGLPLPQSLAFGRAFEDLALLDAAYWRCHQTPETCWPAFFDVIDYDADGSLTQIELSQMATSMLAIGDASIVGLGQEARNRTLNAHETGPAAADAILRSFDRDGSGGIERGEVPIFQSSPLDAISDTAPERYALRLVNGFALAAHQMEALAAQGVSGSE